MKTNCKKKRRREVLIDLGVMTSPISQARRILKTSRMEKLQKKVAIAIKKTLTAPQVRKLEEVRRCSSPAM